MDIHVFTVLPQILEPALAGGLLGKARERGVVSVVVHDLRHHTTDRHRSVDDTPFGGGAGMVLAPEPIFRAVESVQPPRPLYLLSPGGRRFDQPMAAELAAMPGFSLLCGRYEGVDERVREHLVDDELSIGDFVLAGGEAAAFVVVEAVTRLVPGVMGNEASIEDESFAGHGVQATQAGHGVQATQAGHGVQATQAGHGVQATQAGHGVQATQAGGLLEYPHYTRPAEFRGWPVPDVLRSGDHGRIARWRRAQALVRTMARRPDLIAARGGLTADERRLLDEFGYRGNPR